MNNLRQYTERIKRGWQDNKLAILITYLLFSLFILRGVIFSKGIIIGNDWGGLPSSIHDISNTFKEYQYLWSNAGNALGILNFAQNSLITMSVMKLLSLFSVDGILFNKLFLLLVFTLSAFSMFSLLDFFKLNRPISIISGLIYVTTPLFFNYTIMGWTYVLLFMALLPFGVLYFIKANRENDWRYQIIVAVLFELMLLQSQSMVWFPMVLVLLSIYLVRSKKDLLIYLKQGGILILLTIGFNLWWLLSTFLIKSPVVFGSDILMSTESLGASVLITPINIIRLYGSLLNSQYEYILQHFGLAVISFLTPLLVALSFLLKNDKRLRFSFFAISLVPLVFYFLNFHRGLLQGIPLINIVRDFGRFSVLSTFALVVLVAFLLDFLYQNKIKAARISAYIIFGLFFILSLPWDLNYLTKYQPNLGEAQRIRAKEFPSEYSSFKQIVDSKLLDSKGLYLPSEAIVEFSDDERFNGEFQGFYDNYFASSSFHGLYPSNSRNTGYGDLITKKLLDLKDPESYKNFLKITDISTVVVRLNMVFDYKDKIISALDNDSTLVKTFVSDKIVAYSKKSDQYLPHFYIPTQTSILDGTVDSISGFLTERKDNFRSVFFLASQNKDQQNSLNKISKTISTPPTIEFKKINPTKYRLVFHQASSPFPLVFSESYHTGWKLYNVKLEEEDGAQLNGRMSNYSTFVNNQEEQATKEEIVSFINQRYISTLGDQQPLQFVSKNYQGTIQNDNLANGSFAESWFAKNSDQSPARNKSVVSLSNSPQLIANGYANSWLIDPESICTQTNNCVKNIDGSYDMELLVEFWPQRLFYLGLLLSGTTILGLLSVVIITRKKKANV